MTVEIHFLNREPLTIRGVRLINVYLKDGIGRVVNSELVIQFIRLDRKELKLPLEDIRSIYTKQELSR